MVTILYFRDWNKVKLTAALVALLFLPPPPPVAVDTVAIKTLRNALALLAGLLFFRLPLAYHVPMSVGLTYQLGLVGLYGGCRVLDAFFISPYLFKHVPRRVKYIHDPRVQTPLERNPKTPRPSARSTVRTANGSAITSPSDTAETDSGKTGRRGSIIPSAQDSYFALKDVLAGPNEQPVIEMAESEDGWPHSFLDRASWALELELSMRGVGFTWSTADVRHTKKTFLPTVANRVHSILMHVLPVVVICLATIKGIYSRYLEDTQISSTELTAMNVFDERLSFPLQIALTAALGAFLMAAFSLAHSAFAILCSPLAPGPLAYFPPLYTTPVYNITSVRGFWAYGWHRLFARLFLVYGVWPGEWLERQLTGKTPAQPADLGKVLGGFLSSAFVHSFAVRGVLAGQWRRAYGEALFFSVNGAAVIVEGLIGRAVRRQRKRRALPEQRWYDAWVGRAWWMAVLLTSGRNFARGWVNAGLVREMAEMVTWPW